MSPIRTVTSSSSVSPMARPSLRTFSASPPGSNRLSRSPCSSRSTIAWYAACAAACSAPAVPVLAPSDSLRKSCSTASATAAAVVPRDTAIALMGLPSATSRRSCLVGNGQAGIVGDGLHQRLDDLGIENRPARSRPRAPRVPAGSPPRRDPSADTRTRPRRRRAARSRSPDRRTARARPPRCRGAACAAPWPRRCLHVWKLGGIRMSVTSTCGSAASAPASRLS